MNGDVLLRDAQDLAERTSPFADLRSARRDVIWMQPKLRVEISYAEVAGGRLRAPVWRRVVSADASDREDRR